MSDYECPECGTGFPEKHGRKKIKNPQWFGDPEKADSLWLKCLIKIDNAMVSSMKTAYKIECPDCGHVIGDTHS